MLSINNNSESVLDRVLGRHRRDGTTTTVTSHSTVTTVPARQFDLGDTLRNTAVGGAIGAALGGAALLGKFAVPLLGGVKNLSGIVRFGTLGAGIGLATAVLPVIAPDLDRHPTLKAALTGASIGATAGMFLPLISPVGGALVGAAIGASAHLLSNRRNDNVYCPPGYPRPGMLDRLFGNNHAGHNHSNISYSPAYPGAGMISPYGYGAPVGYGSPIGYNAPIGYASTGYGMPYAASPYGYGQLGMTARPQAAGQAAPQGMVISPTAAGMQAVPARAATAPPAKPRKKLTKAQKAKNAKAAKARAAKAAKAAKAAARAQAAQQAQIAAQAQLGATNPAAYGQSMITSPASYVSPSIARMLPFNGGTPFTMGQQFSQAAPMMLQGMGLNPNGQPYNPAGSTPVLTGPIGQPVLPGVTG